MEPSDVRRHLEERLRTMIGRGTSRDDALGQLGREAGNPLDMVVAMRAVFNLSISEALHVLHALPVWRERIQRVYDDTDAFFGALTSPPCEDWWTPDQRGLVEDRSVAWRRQSWKVRDAWASPDGSSRPFEASPDAGKPPDGMRLVKGGWDHDHCQLCWEKLAEAPHGQPEGYTDGTHRWLCIACFETYLAPRLEDTNGMRQLAGHAILAKTFPLKDGAFDPYAFAATGDIARGNYDMFRSVRMGKGPTDEEVERGDYTNFPWERYRGDGSGIRGPVRIPLLWEKEPGPDGQHLVGWNDGSCLLTSPADLKAALKR